MRAAGGGVSSPTMSITLSRGTVKLVRACDELLWLGSGVSRFSVERLVPFAVEVVPGQDAFGFKVFHLLIGDLHARGIGRAAARYAMRLTKRCLSPRSTCR